MRSFFLLKIKLRDMIHIPETLEYQIKINLDILKEY